MENWIDTVKNVTSLKAAIKLCYNDIIQKDLQKLCVLQTVEFIRS